MKRWPPAYPKNELAVAALERVIENAQLLLADEDLSPEERKILKTMRPGNTTVGLSIEKSDKLSVLLETFRKIRFRTHRVLISPPVDHYFSLPVPLAHAAVNALPKDHARVLSNLLAHDFVDFSQEQYEFARSTGASRRELNKIDPQRYNGSLREIHRLIRERALPLEPV